MQVSSSITTTPPEPSIEPALASESKSMATSHFFGLQHRAGRSAGDHGLQLLAAADAAADFVDHPPEVEAHRQLVDARAC